MPECLILLERKHKLRRCWNKPSDILIHLDTVTATTYLEWIISAGHVAVSSRFRSAAVEGIPNKALSVKEEKSCVSDI